MAFSKPPDITLKVYRGEVVELIRANHRQMGGWIDSLDPFIDDNVVRIIEDDARRLLELILSLKQADPTTEARGT